jgi:4-nitrophenyl phosphatase
MVERAARGTVVFDLDGVVYRGDHEIPGAGVALAELTSAGWHVLFATNNSSKTRYVVADKITARTGFEVDPQWVVTSGMAAARYMQGRFASAYVLGLAGITDEVRAAGIDVRENSDVESVVVGIRFDMTYDHVAIASEAVRNGAAFIATNTDATYPTAEGLAPGAGAVVAAVATASGREPTICGKPHAPMGALVSDLARGNEIWMVGDRLETDILLAKNQKWRSILTLTGVTTSRDQIPAGLAPDHVVKSIIEVPAVVGRPEKPNLSSV